MRIRKQTHVPVLLAALLGGVGVSGLQAQESGSPYSYLFKLRAGLTAGDMQTTHFDNKVMGFGAEVRREMFGNGQALTAELTWEYVPGRHHETEMFPTLNLNPRYSYDNRKEGGAGINLRLAYSAPAPRVFGAWINDNIAKDMNWFAGLGIDRFKVRSEVKYTLNLMPNPSENPPPGQYDGGAHVTEESKFVPGVFAGLNYRLNEDVVFELSLRNFGMFHYEFVPAAYYGGELGTGRSSTGSTRGWALEFAIALKL